jgi:uncharacterized protein
MPDATKTIRVEVAYADESLQLLRVVEVGVTATAQQAIDASGILDSLPATFTLAKVGIFGRIVSPSDRLCDGDRVELYRPLKLDPKEARRQRAVARK